MESNFPSCELGDSITVTGPGGGKKNVEFKNAVERYMRELLQEEDSWLTLGLQDSFYEAMQEDFALDNSGITDALADRLSNFGGLDAIGFTDAFIADITSFEGLNKFGIKDQFASEVNQFDGLDSFGLTQAIKEKAGAFGGGDELGIGGEFNETTRTTSIVTLSDPATGAEIDVERIDSVEFQNDNGFVIKLNFNNI